MIPLYKIEDSYERIKRYLKPTRLEKSLNLSDEGSEVYLKLENEQPLVKSFKIRGVLSKLTTLSKADISNTEITAISSGNHGIALAYCAQLLQIKSPIIYVPITAPTSKVEKIEYFGAKVVQIGNVYDDTHVKAKEIIAKNGYINVDSREDEIGVVGQGGVGIEILQQLPEVEVIIVPMGSGALAVSTASYFKQKKPDVKVYAIEAAYSPALIKNLKNGIWTETFDITTNEEPLLKSLIGGCAKFTFDNAEVLEDILLVNDEDAKKAVAEIAKKEKAIVEPDSAVVYAAYKNNIELFKGKKTVLIITGGNIDDDLFKEIIVNYY